MISFDLSPLYIKKMMFAKLKKAYEHNEWQTFVNKSLPQYNNNADNSMKSNDRHDFSYYILLVF